jgi:hypothetical protein
MLTLSDDALDAVSGGLDMNPATTGAGHYAPGQKLPPAPAAAPGNQPFDFYGALADGMMEIMNVVSHIP